MRLDEGLLRKAKKEAARRGKTLTALIDEGLRLVVEQGAQPTKQKRVRIPVSRERGGTMPGVDISSNANLLDVMDGLD